MTAPVVIIGGGFGGLYTALELARRPGHPPLLLLEPRDRFIFLPFLYELLSKELPLWQIAPRYDALLAGHGIGWLRDRVVELDPDRHQLRTQGGQTLSYSRLVLAWGAELDSCGVPGVLEHAQGFRNLADVERLQALVQRLKATPRPLQRLVVVGAGPAGVELACKLADLLQGAALVELLERGPIALPQARSFNREQALLAMQRKDVRLRCHCQVQAVTAEGLHLGQGEQLAAAGVIWTAGQRSRPPLGISPGPVPCKATLEVENLPDVFALGDGAKVSHEPALAPTAQVAFQQAPLLATNLLHSLAGEPLENFQWKDLGEMLSLGIGEASLTGMGFTLAGPGAQQLRRWAYLTRLPGQSLPLKVAADWLAEWTATPLQR